MPLRDRDWAGVATWLLSAALVLYLALENGGYDPIPRDQVGIAIWWALLLGVAVKALPLPGRTPAARAALGLLLGFAAWTALSLGWTAERRAHCHRARPGRHLPGSLRAGICLVTRRRGGAGQVLHGVTVGLALVAALGVLSRLHMAWFPANELGKVLPGIEIERRLAYPLNYSSAIGALAGMTLPLLLAATASARTVAVRALAAAAIPDRRPRPLPRHLGHRRRPSRRWRCWPSSPSPPTACRSSLTLAAGPAARRSSRPPSHSRDALGRGLPTAAAEQQGTEVVWIALAVCAAVALAQVGIALAVRRLRRPGLAADQPQPGAGRDRGGARRRDSRSRSRAGLPGEVSHRWDDLQGPRAGSDGRAQLALVDPRLQQQRPLPVLGSGGGRERRPRPGRGSGLAPSSSGGPATAPTAASSATPTRSTWRASPSWGSSASS